MITTEPDARIAAWLAGHQHTIAAALAALPAGMAPATQAVNVHAALLAEAGMPDAQVTTEWAARFPAVGELYPATEERARRWVAAGRDAVGCAEHGAELLRRTVVTSAWQHVDGQG